MELNEDAEILSYEEFHPFGSTSYSMHTNDSEVSLKRYKYNGKERDTETGLDYYGARYYASWLCRFVSVDPKKDVYPFQNSFAYAANSPITMTDVNGEGPGNGDGGDEFETYSTVEPDKHTVKKGDTLWDLAKSSGGDYSVEELKSWNPELDPTNLQIGQEINISNPKPYLNFRKMTVGDFYGISDGTDITIQLDNAGVELNVYSEKMEENLRMFNLITFTTMTFVTLGEGMVYMNSARTLNKANPSSRKFDLYVRNPQGVKLSKDELKAAKFYASKKLKVTVQKATGNTSGGKKGERTADLDVELIGKVDVYAPKPTTSVNSVVRGIANKNSQAGAIHVEVPSNSVMTKSEMLRIPSRIFGNLKLNNIKSIVVRQNNQTVLYSRKIE